MTKNKKINTSQVGNLNDTVLKRILGSDDQDPGCVCVL